MPRRSLCWRTMPKSPSFRHAALAHEDVQRRQVAVQHLAAVELAQHLQDARDLARAPRAPASPCPCAAGRRAGRRGARTRAPGSRAPGRRRAAAGTCRRRGWRAGGRRAAGRSRPRAASRRCASLALMQTARPARRASGPGGGPGRPGRTRPRPAGARRDSSRPVSGLVIVLLGLQELAHAAAVGRSDACACGRRRCAGKTGECRAWPERPAYRGTAADRVRLTGRLVSRSLRKP